MPTLRIKLPNHMEVTHQLSGERITIGRRPDNTIQISDRSVSGNHAELIAADGHYRLHDLGSTNMTFVDGAPVPLSVEGIYFSVVSARYEHVFSQSRISR